MPPTRPVNSPNRYKIYPFVKFPATSEKGQTAYSEALDIAKANLPTTHPVRLGLALNYSVFFYEVASSPDRACQLAKQVEQIKGKGENAFLFNTIFVETIICYFTAYNF